MIEFYHYDYGMQLAKRGYVAICPDCRGFGERRDEALQKGTDEKSFLTSTCFIWHTWRSPWERPWRECVPGMRPG